VLPFRPGSGNDRNGDRGVQSSRSVFDRLPPLNIEGVEVAAAAMIDSSEENRRSLILLVRNGGLDWMPVPSHRLCDDQLPARYSGAAVTCGG
jgi:hypothetical protein